MVCHIRQRGTRAGTRAAHGDSTRKGGDTPAGACTFTGTPDPPGPRPRTPLGLPARTAISIVSLAHAAVLRCPRTHDAHHSRLRASPPPPKKTKKKRPTTPDRAPKKNPQKDSQPNAPNTSSSVEATSAREAQSSAPRALQRRVMLPPARTAHGDSTRKGGDTPAGACTFTGTPDPPGPRPRTPLGLPARTAISIVSLAHAAVLRCPRTHDAHHSRLRASPPPPQKTKKKRPTTPDRAPKKNPQKDSQPNAPNTSSSVEATSAPHVMDSTRPILRCERGAGVGLLVDELAAAVAGARRRKEGEDEGRVLEEPEGVARGAVGPALD
ncbi:hypothetical protein B0H16DRAFT_1472499 [Mycena metata]|uniref:Uncharacterized protein n=1 Tax=Mycena metata TaxID=1033252 RepID=A0AAD7MN01_9AGAR|nr:hypothetical protein B0H16DRAFT_1472499 [Mycena metata]